MAARRHAVAVRSRGPRRKSTWIGPAIQSYIAVATTAKVLIASFDAAANGLPSPTVVRTRGEVSIHPTLTSADLTIVGAWGLAVVTDRAFAAGVASLPGPFTDAGWDGWFGWGSFSLRWDFGDATGARLAQVDQIVDSKGMRKITDDETIVLVAESQTGAYNISMPLRLLMLLS